jgi:uncharacterized protein YlxW (UPF0749 family)
MQRPAPRVTVAIAAALLGFLSVLAVRQPPRAARDLRRLELVDLIRLQDARVRRLAAEVRELKAGLARAGIDRTRRLRRQVGSAAARVGTTPVEGPGVVVTLDDSPARRSPTGDPNDLLVHERDIQTVVNALWAAGAEAVGIGDHRLTTLSAVRCAGNTLLLHGRLHSPPYRIGAIGDSTRLAATLPDQAGMARLLSAVRDVGLRLEVDTGTVRISSSQPAPAVQVARPVEEVA